MNDAVQRRCIGVIPARGGSKGIPRKNLAALGNRPLLAWTIEAAQGSQSLDRLIVSTDDEAIAAVARELGAEVPFVRPAELSEDATPTADVARHTLEWLVKHGEKVPDYVVVLQATSPFRIADDIENAVALAIERRAGAVISVTAMHGHPSWMRRVAEDGHLLPWDSATMASQRQDTNVPYLPNGAVFVVRGDLVATGESWYGSDAWAYIMPAERSLDIDSEWDLHLARLIAEDRRK